MADPIPQADPNRQLLAEAVEQIRRLCDLLAGGLALPSAAGAAVATPMATPTGAGASASGTSGLTDVTNYTFRAPPTVGSRVTVRRIPDVGSGEQLRAAGQAYAYGIADLLGAEDLSVSPTDTLSSGAEHVVVTGRLPGEPGGAAVLRAAFVRLPSGSVNVEFVARANDPAAEGQFRDVLRTLRPAGAADPVSAAFASVTGSAATNQARSAGPVAFDLAASFRGPAAAAFASADRRVRFEVALVGADAPEPAVPPAAGKAFVGTLGSATGDDGRTVLYEVAPARPPASAMGAGAAAAMPSFAAPPAAAEATREIEVNGRRLRVKVVAGDSATAQSLVRDALDRIQPRPE